MLFQYSIFLVLQTLTSHRWVIKKIEEKKHIVSLRCGVTTNPQTAPMLLVLQVPKLFQKHHSSKRYSLCCESVDDIVGERCLTCQSNISQWC